MNEHFLIPTPTDVIMKGYDVCAIKKKKLVQLHKHCDQLLEKTYKLQASSVTWDHSKQQSKPGRHNDSSLGTDQRWC